MATVSNTSTTGRRSPHESSRSRRRRAVARTAIVAGSVLAVAVFIPSSLASWLDPDHPETAARIAPWNARVAADAAGRLGADPRVPEVRSLVQKALARDLTLTPAIELRAADLAASGHQAEAARLFHLSDGLSRRSLPTRLWLIQDAVDRGDVEGALRNFDIALRTSTDAPAILYPVLARASADPRLTVPLARTLDRLSDWRLMFLEWTLANGANAHSIANVVAEMRDRAFIKGNDVDQLLIERLVTARDFQPAVLLHQRFRTKPSAMVADWNFADPSARYPFGWGLVGGGSLGAERALSSAGPMLAYHAAPATSGQLAAQLLDLAPGRYVLTTKTAAAAGAEAPYWSISCGENTGGEIGRLDQPPAAGERGSTVFTVPPGCAAQWLTLSVRPGADAPQSGAIAWVSVSPR